MRSDERAGIVGLNGFIAIMSKMKRGAEQDDLYSDWWMIKIEESCGLQSAPMVPGSDGRLTMPERSSDLLAQAFDGSPSRNYVTYNDLAR